MTKPHRIQLRHTKGWRMPENTVKVDRSTKWGNPFNLKSPDHCWTAISVGCKGDPAGRHEASVILYREWMTDGRGARRIQDCGLYAEHNGERIALSVSPAIELGHPPDPSELRGKNLACWCAPDKPCHADVLLELANR